jgi:ABC-type nitrate/sulfonate/bicarbonate transport system permease component
MASRPADTRRTGRTGAHAAVRATAAIVGIATFLLAWAALCAAQLFSPVLLPSPLVVARAGGDLVIDGSLLGDVLASLVRVGIGFAIGAAAGLVLGTLVARMAWMALFVRPVLELLRPIPGIAWIPLAILWFGIGNAPAYFIVAMTSFFPVFVSTHDGVRDVPRQFLDLGACLRAPRLRVLGTIVLPAALPRIITGLQVALGVAWATVIAAELVAASSGLGYMIMLNRTMLQTPQVFVGIASIGLLGAAMTLLFDLAVKIILPWARWVE